MGGFDEAFMLTFGERENSSCYTSTCIYQFLTPFKVMADITQRQNGMQIGKNW